MTTYAVAGGRRLRAALRVPGDKSISHRALILGALAEGTTTVRGLSGGDDVRHTAAAVAALGAEVDVSWGPDGGSGTVAGGRSRLHGPEGVVDVGNSGTGIRLLAGVCAGIDGLSVISGDESVARRPMDRVVEPLRAMGARIDGRDGGRLPPLEIRGGRLKGIDHTMAVPSAQVKSAILLAGLDADGPTVVREPRPTRAHTEEMLARCGATIEVVDGARGSMRVVTLTPSTLQAAAWDVPGDPSQAAYWLVAACLVPGSEVVVENVYLGPHRAGFLDVLARMGAEVERIGEQAVRAAYSPALDATDVEPDEIPGLIDEIPVLAVAAARARGTTRFLGVGELRVKETDRMATVESELSLLGGRVRSEGDVLAVTGGGRLVGARVRSHGDHRIAMAMAVAGLAAEGETVVEGWEAVATSYPGFGSDLERCLGDDGRAA